MRLRKLKLKNFRGYRNSTEIIIDESMTGIVGRNDFGKSTLLEALAIFFETEGMKADKNDMNCFSLREGDGRFEIACEFDDLPDFIMIDDRVQTTLASEHLLNEDGNFEIVKTFKATTSGKPEQTCIRCIHPDEEPLRNLLGMKISELKAVGKEVEKNVADKRTASLWRQAIREAAAPYTCSEIMLDVDKEFGTDTKSLWGKILDLLPTYAIFKADRESSDGDSEAKNPLQQAVKDAQAALQDKITALENEIQDSVLDVAQRTLDKLREMAPELASELTPRFKEKPKWTFNFTLDGENGIPINKRGSGIRRLILLNFFRAEAEKNVAGTPRNVIYAIEEPETSQHPNYQMMLMKALLALAGQPHRQIIVTTHVPALAGLIPVEGVRYVTRNEAGGEASLLRVAAAVEKGSQHPLGMAVVRAAQHRGIMIPAVSDFNAPSGKGVSGDVEGQRVVIGNELAMQENSIVIDNQKAVADKLRMEGATVIYVATDGYLAGLIAISDPVKATTPDALKALRQAGIRIVMLTGDNQLTAEAVARKLGIDEVEAGILPDGKKAVITRLKASGHVVAMAGDGVNDAPALAAADVGIAMGTGTDVAIESAGVTLLKGDLMILNRARHLSEITMKNIRQNLFFAFIYNALGVPVAAGLLYPVYGILLSPVIAAAAMALSSVSVIVNALRLKSVRLGK
ncbi:TPA: HAD-IC family P-type ATPase [Escherichia coli]